MDARHEMDGVDHERRAALLLGLAGMSVAVVGQGRGASAQQTPAGQAMEAAPGVSERVVSEVPSMVPGFAKVRLLEVTWQPGAKAPADTMKDPMICEMSRGELDEIKNRQPVKRKVGDLWTCAVGDVDEDVNNGTEPAVMRVFILMKA